MWKLLKQEITKSKRTYLFASILILWLISFFWIGAGVSQATNSQGHNMYFENNMFITIQAFITPLLIVLTSNELIHKELETKMYQVLNVYDVSLWKLYLIKCLYAIVLLSILIVCQYELFVMLGIIGTTKSLTIKMLFNIILSIICMTLLQTGLYLIMKKESTALIIGLFASVISFFEGGLNFNWLNIFLPWTYVRFLDPITIQPLGVVHNYWYYIMFVIVVTVCIFFYMRKKIKVQVIN